MSARDELYTLADIIGDKPANIERIGKIAAARRVLDAGYRKPRTITTAEELDALPAKTAILDSEGTPWVGDGDPVEPWASVCEDPLGGPIWKNSRDVALPVTVLYTPEASK